MILEPSKDALGNAVEDYFNGVDYAALAVFSSIDDNYFLECKELFRHYLEMSDVDHKALELCEGKILDVGAGAGSHAVYLQEKEFDVTALEISPKACEIIKERGVSKVVNTDFFDFSSEVKFDTLLLMMNGIGFVGSVDGLRSFLQKAKSLLSTNGKVIFDSTFLSEDHKEFCAKNGSAFGQVDYQMFYDEYATDQFFWLYIDFEVLKGIAKEEGFVAELEYTNDREEYIASLSLG